MFALFRHEHSNFLTKKFQCSFYFVVRSISSYTVLSICVDGDKLPPHIIFRAKSNYAYAKLQNNPFIKDKKYLLILMKMFGLLMT